jgi:2-succinyl-5-enolpyruvyl-6-hydroxy-3-cyclohexene-1-carboxylate synthase
MPLHSDKKSVRLLSSLLKQQGIFDIVISPGSRNAPLIIEFTHQKEFTNYSVIDERSAGFFALGIAQQKNKPVVLICTSGSALLNYYPAIAEAFYSKIPLIVISADRPQKWVDQGEGQTIRQHAVFKNHSYYNITLQKNQDDQNSDFIYEAIKTAIEKRGPVHINMPFDEPLYNTVNIQEPPHSYPLVQNPDPVLPDDYLNQLLKIWQGAKKIMILAGQLFPSKTLSKQLLKINEDQRLVILTENISNQNQNEFINHIDQNIFLLPEDQLEKFKPDLLITIGRNIISKKVKKFLRKHKPAHHWHVEKTDIFPDTFEALTEKIYTSPQMFFSQFLFLIYDQMNISSSYKKQWEEHKKEQWKKHSHFLEKTPFSDLQVFDFLSKNIPDKSMIQWGNSSSIRYAQFFKYPKNVLHFANRGTSGIDGSGSTAAGAAQVYSPSFLITGDISFFYDSNALWNKYLPDHFKIILINNGGGDIFNFIPGPSQTKALEEFFVTKHNMRSQLLAKQFDIKYKQAKNKEELSRSFPEFLAEKGPVILEIDTQEKNNSQILKEYFKHLFT